MALVKDLVIALLMMVPQTSKYKLNCTMMIQCQNKHHTLFQKTTELIFELLLFTNFILMKLKSFLITDKTLVPRNKWTTIKQIKHGYSWLKLLKQVIIRIFKILLNRGRGSYFSHKKGGFGKIGGLFLKRGSTLSLIFILSLSNLIFLWVEGSISL